MSVVNSEMRANILKLQEVLKTLPQPTDTFTFHHFANGMYARECRIGKGIVFVGKIHKQEHFFILLQGSVNITSDDGVVTMKAPCIVVSPPNTKRAGVTIEDCTFITIHKVSTYNIEEIEKEVTLPEEGARFDALNNLKPGTLTYMGEV